MPPRQGENLELFPPSEPTKPKGTRLSRFKSGGTITPETLELGSETLGGSSHSSRDQKARDSIKTAVLSDLLEDLAEDIRPYFQTLFPHRNLIVRSRKNRSTMGSLRGDVRDPRLFRFTIAEGLLKSRFEDAVLLARILMLRMARKRVPAAWTQALNLVRERWTVENTTETPLDKKLRLADSDVDLELHMHALAHHLPELVGLPLPRIMWWTSRSKRILGRYLPDEHLIQIHSGLAHPQVPSAVLNDLIHHELLHVALGTPMKNGRRQIHTPLFRHRERNFPAHDEARRWIKRHLRRILNTSGA